MNENLIQRRYMVFVDGAGRVREYEIERFFHLATLPECDSVGSLGLHGFNVGISVSEEDWEEMKDDIFNVSWEEEGRTAAVVTIVYVNGVEVPVSVMVTGANEYTEDFGTACLFGWVKPDSMIPDARPVL